jgi:hypothetical protein
MPSFVEDYIPHPRYPNMRIPKPQTNTFQRTLDTPPAGEKQPGQAGGPPLTSGTAMGPDGRAMPFFPNIPGVQQHNTWASQLGTPPGPSIQNNQYNSAISNGILPDHAIQNASEFLRRPVASPQFPGSTPQQQQELSTQFQDLMRSKTMAGDIDLRRSGAEAQADMGLRRQIAMADAGIGGGNLVSRLNEVSQARAQPILSQLLNLLNG